MTEQESLATTREARPGDPAPARPKDATHHPPRAGRYHEEQVRLPKDKDAKLAFLRETIENGAARGWRMVSAAKQQGAAVLLVTWDTQGSLSD